MGDVGAGEPPNVPYEPRGTLRGDQLTVPLVIKFPGNEFAGHSVERPVTTVDVSKTILAAFGLDASEGMLADDLEQVEQELAIVMTALAGISRNKPASDQLDAPESDASIRSVGQCPQAPQSLAEFTGDIHGRCWCW